MATKTYNTLSTVTAGSVLTATAYNEAVENSNNYRVPPMCRVNRTGSTASITPGATGWATFNNQIVDTEEDEMWTSGAGERITIRTAGLYFFHAVIGLQYTGTPTTTQLTMAHVPSGGSPETTIGSYYSPGEPASFGTFTVSGTYPCAVGDYVRVRLDLLTGASAISLRNVDFSVFSAMWLGQVS